MKRFIEGEDREQSSSLPALSGDYVSADSPVRVVDVFVDELNLAALGFSATTSHGAARSANAPALR